jgi:hypothetical protein
MPLKTGALGKKMITFRLKTITLYVISQFFSQNNKRFVENMNF